MAKRRPRQVDVAKHAGVSPAIVSLVLNGKTDDKIRISPQTVERVKASMRELGYMPNPIARSLATGHNRILGVFTYESVFPLQSENFYFPVLVGIEDEVEAQDYDLLLFTRSRRYAGRRSVYRDGVNQLLMADGSIVFGRDVAADEVARLHDEGYPFVSIGRVETDRPISYVATDYAGATFEVIEYLVGHAHRSIAYLGAPDRSVSYRDREGGYRMAHEHLGLALDERRVRYVDPETLRADDLQALLDGGATAIVCEHHRLAVALLRVARQLGLSAPRDFSLALLGEPPRAADSLANCTTFRIPLYAIGVEAVRLLARVLDGHEGPLRSTLSCDFVSGHTVATLAP
ncbi:MAG: LacI family transcriptional regulator [Trueperaceae bacterium]|nr:MAG: LacI family transcriptional regulator [Trueperaceae bacterium]